MTVLLRHDLRIVRNSARAAFRRKRDWLPFVIGLPILAAALAQVGSSYMAGAAGLPLTLLVGAGGLVGLVLGLAIERRLDHLRQHSMVARFALQRREALIFAAVWHLPVLLVLIAGLAFLAVPITVAAAYAMGALIAPAASLARRMSGRLIVSRGGITRVGAGPLLTAPSRRQRVVQLLVGRAGLLGLPAAPTLLLFAGPGVAAGVFYLLMPNRGGVAASVIVLLALLALLSRQHPPLWRYLLHLGQVPLPAALIPVGMAAAMLAGFVLSLGVAGGTPWTSLLTGAASALMLFAFAASLRALHYATKPVGLANLAFQLDLIALAVTGLLIWPLAPLLALVRVAQLQRRARALRYLRR